MKKRKTTQTEHRSLLAAAVLIGGQAAVAKVCGFADRRNVWPWFRRGVPVPAAFCPVLEHATGGRITVESLRGDVAWVRIPDQDWPVSGGRPCIDAFSSPARMHEFQVAA